MALNIKKTREIKSYIPTASMADITFMLIIFFVLTTTFTVDKTTVELPDALSRKEAAQESALVLVHIEYESRSVVENPVFSVLFHRSDGLYVSSTNTYDVDPLELEPICGRGTLIIEIDSLNLYSGEYFLSVGAYRAPDPPYWATPDHFLDKQFKFRVISEQRHGVMVMPARWKHTPWGNGR